MGREKELTLLKEEFNKLGEDPHKPIIIISGEAGIGKTRLLKKVRTILKNSVFIKVECQKEEKEPYACCNKVADSLINLIEKNYKEFLKVYGDILVTLSPKLKSKRYLRKIKPLKEIEKYYIFEKFLQFIINLPIEKNIVIALEDSQYLSKESIEFLKYLTLGMPVTSNIIFIVTYREEEKPDDLIEFEKAIEGHLIKILLERLNIQSTRKFITSMIGEIEENELEYISDKIFKKTAGVPLFIEHFVRLLIEEKALKKEEDTWVINKDRLSGIELTGTTLQIIQEKLKRVPNKKLMRVIQYASIMGGEYINSLILNEIMDKDIQEELETLNNQWILRKESIEGNERFKFAHPMIKEIAYQMIPEEKKKELHKKVGLVLEKHFPEEKAMLAYHFSLAGVKKKAYKYSLKAAENAEGNFAYLDTIPLYETALRFTPNETKSTEIKIKLAALCSISSNFEKGVKYLNEVISQKIRGKIKVKAMVELMRIKILQGKINEAYKIGESTLNLTAKGTSKAKAEIYTILGQIFALKGKCGKAKDYLMQSLPIGDKLGDKELQAETRNVMGAIYWFMGENNMAVKSFKEALKFAKNKNTIAKICSNLGTTCDEMNNSKEAEFYFERTIEINKKIGNMRDLGVAYNNFGLKLQGLGRINDALKYYKIALEYTKRIGYKALLPLVYINIGRVYAMFNNATMAIEYCNKSLKLLDDEQSEIWIIYNVYEIAGDIHLYLEDFSASIQYYKKSMELVKKLNNNEKLNRTLIQLSDIYADKGNLDKAKDLLLKVEKYAKDKKNTKLLGLCHRVRAKIIQNNSPQDAMRYLEDSLEAFNTPRSGTEKALSLYEMGKLYLKMNKYQDALDVFLETKEILQKREELYWLKKVQNSIKEVGKLLSILPKRVSLEASVLTSIVKFASRKIPLDRFIKEVLTFVKSTLQINQTAVIIFADGKMQKVYSNEEINGETQQDIARISKSVYQRKEFMLTQEGLSLYIPIKTEDRIEGIFYMREELNRFETETIEFLQLLSSILGIGIEYIRLREKCPTVLLQREKVPLRFDNIIGESESMQKVYNLIKSCIGSDVAILLEGETGVGKELVAKAIHSHSKRKGNFVPIYCGGMPYSLFEGEIFGYKKGSFTGAFHDKRGLLEEADGGTILLDEITSIPLSIQAKLLRVLQEGEFRRLGETKHRKVDAQIISATNQNIEELLNRGEFRLDLFYRISTIRIIIPPLRERKEDIPLLANYFLVRFNKKIDRDIRGFSQEAMQTMINYRWEGNVRELEHEIERLTAITEKEIISVDDLKKEIKETKQIDSRNPASLYEFIQDKERKYISKALTQCNFNISRTAKLLKVSRTTVYRKIEELQIPLHHKSQ
ncbi:sigma 54-interacting transcriptional regulator [candidate division WOR-3 bacterium]|nr:sigma 54-interacting transcriptional regulator [candidate division WOR-3 bacterium]